MSVQNVTPSPTSIILRHQSPPLLLSNRFCSWAIKRLQWWADRLCGSRNENKQLTTYSPLFWARAFTWVGQMDTPSVSWRWLPLISSCRIGKLCERRQANLFLQRREPHLLISIRATCFRYWGSIRLSWRKDSSPIGHCVGIGEWRILTRTVLHGRLSALRAVAHVSCFLSSPCLTAKME